MREYEVMTTDWIRFVEAKTFLQKDNMFYLLIDGNYVFGCPLENLVYFEIDREVNPIKNLSVKVNMDTEDINEIIEEIKNRIKYEVF